MPKNTFIGLHAEKRRRIYEGLIEAFYVAGYEAVTVADIVKACRIPRGSFYMYFEDKFDAFLYVLKHAQEEKMTYINPLLKRLDREAFFDIYEALVKAGIDYAEDNPKLVKLWMRFYHSSNYRLDDYWRQFETQAIDILKGYLLKDQARGYIRPDVDLLALAKMLYHIQAIDIMERFAQGVKTEAILTSVRAFLDIIKFGIKEVSDEK